MAEQKERFMSGGEFTDGPCGSHFCKGGCRDDRPAGVGFNLFAIWERAYDEYPDDSEKAAARARELYEAETGKPVDVPKVIGENVFATRAIFFGTTDVIPSEEYL